VPLHPARVVPLLLCSACLAASPVPTAPEPGQGPDAEGGWIYYLVATDTGATSTSIWRIRPDSGAPERVPGPTNAAVDAGFDVLPGGRKLAVPVAGTLFVWTPGQVGADFALPSARRLGPVRWSPDWRSLLAVSEGPDSSYRLSVIPVVGSAERTVLTSPASEPLAVGGWYAGGDSVIVMYRWQGAQVVRLRDGTRRPLSTLFDNREVRSVAPRGDRALLVGPPTGPAGRDHRWRVQDPATGTVLWERVLRGRPRAVTWSPDGRLMVFAHESELPELPGAVLYRLNLSTGALEVLVGGPGIGASPRWVVE